IATSLLLGVNREKAARFSFLMVLPPILGAAGLKMMKYLGEPPTEAATPALTIIVGFVTAFLVGLLACTWMIKIVKNSKLSYFAIYCAVAGVLSIIFSILR
ncbi:MAG: undecaprenyl-diphosphate phosphatase, partial [Bacteroidota bacterium]